MRRIRREDWPLLREVLLKALLTDPDAFGSSYEETASHDDTWSEDRLDYTIVRAAVNMASRLESTAAPDQIHISHSTYALIRDEVYCRPLGDVALKGISHRVRTYEVVGEFKDHPETHRIRAEIGDFNLSLDPMNLDPDSAERARQALRSALAALETDPDLTDAS